jgi:hypothetical protein
VDKTQRADVNVEDYNNLLAILLNAIYSSIGRAQVLGSTSVAKSCIVLVTRQEGHPVRVK